MIANRWTVSLVLSGALLAGCDDKKDTPKVDSKVSTPTDDAKKILDKGLDTSKAAATDATKSATDATKAGTDAAAAAKTQAADWMGKLEDAIKANKLDEAKTYVDKIDSVKDSLPADLKSKYDSLKTMFDAAKAKASLPAVPAVPGLSK